ncbi:hypothetical protein WR25_25190 [Diploscapter pachys]|uniref:C2H2-type domain-containing protein n=1 Tax=Diploscapter pachys TaxID=2018661 RepID=A0A2A2L2N0_9BILA|nr:hypothetical protein WR25_25190 [Diploscapter pachys]
MSSENKTYTLMGRLENPPPLTAPHFAPNGLNFAFAALSAIHNQNGTSLAAHPTNCDPRGLPQPGQSMARPIQSMYPPAYHQMQNAGVPVHPAHHVQQFLDRNQQLMQQQQHSLQSHSPQHAQLQRPHIPNSSTSTPQPDTTMPSTIPRTRKQAKIKKDRDPKIPRDKIILALECEVCHEFVNCMPKHKKNCMKSHVAIRHMEIKRYKCSECDFSTKAHSSMKPHFRLHPDIQCEVVDRWTEEHEKEQINTARVCFPVAFDCGTRYDQFIKKD